jgi:hypothetical protein
MACVDEDQASRSCGRDEGRALMWDGAVLAEGCNPSVMQGCFGVWLAFTHWGNTF